MTANRIRDRLIDIDDQIKMLTAGTEDKCIEQYMEVDAMLRPLENEKNRLKTKLESLVGASK